MWLGLMGVVHCIWRAACWQHMAWQALTISSIWLSATFWWLFISMHSYGGLSAMASGLAVFLLAMGLGICHVLFWLGFWWFIHGGGRGIKNNPQHANANVAKHGETISKTQSKSGLLLASFALSLAFASANLLGELLRDAIFTGFPWGAIGYAFVDSILARLAPWLGVYGIGFVVAFIATLPVVLFESKAKFAMWLSVGAGALLCLPVQMPSAIADGTLTKPLTVHLVQSNIPQNEKFQEQDVHTTSTSTSTSTKFDALSWYTAQLALALDMPEVDLIVFPETALPMPIEQLPTGYWRHWQTMMQTAQKNHPMGVATIVGMPTIDAKNNYRNSAVVLSGTPFERELTPVPVLNQRNNPSQTPTVSHEYHKRHLVPFGEFVPPFLQWFVDAMHIPLGSFARGGTNQMPFTLAKQRQRMGIHICYEDVFGDELAQSFTNTTTQPAPTVLVNLSNIGWFGNTIAIDQHLQMARMRAKELHRPIVRATNTGATVAIDANGNVTASLPRWTRGTLTAQVQGQTDITPYAQWAGRWGLWPLWIFGIGLWLCIGIGLRWGSVIRCALLSGWHKIKSMT